MLAIDNHPYLAAEPYIRATVPQLIYDKTRGNRFHIIAQYTVHPHVVTKTFFYTQGLVTNFCVPLDWKL